MRRVVPIVLAACAASSAQASITLLTQQRTITAITSADANTQTISAPDFAPFVQTISLATTFTTASGTLGANSARTEINCVSDPNAILANGSFDGEGGINDDGDQEFGESSVFLFFTFTVSEPTAFSLIASARTSTLPTDEFEIELANISGGEDPFRLPNGAPPQDVNISGILQPGTYSLLYQQEFTSLGAAQAVPYTFAFLVPTPSALAVASVGGLFASRRRTRRG